MEIRLPRLGEGADSGTVASIFVKEGEYLKKDQPILELESEKAVATIPSPESGTVSKIHVKEGDEIKVGTVILSLSTDGGAAVRTHPEPETLEDAAEAEAQEIASAGAAPAPREAGGPLVPAGEGRGTLAPPPPQGIPAAASPSIRKLARELGIDLTLVRGSERGGRIVMADLRRYLHQLQQAAGRPQPSPPPSAPPPERPGLVPIDFSRWGAVERSPMTKLRRTISSRMAESWTTVPHVTQFDEADITRLLALKKKYDTRYAKKDARLTLTAIAIRAVVPVLQQHPRLNASLDEPAGDLVLKRYYHIGIAVDTDQGLIVPVVRDADRKSLVDLSRELQGLAEKTRQRKVGLEEMQGGSFTISNQGGIGSGHFTPIVNTPEVAILGIGRGLPKPVVRGSRVERRTILPLSLSYDHRILDGANAARFMVDLVQAFEGFPEAEFRNGL
jgi:pyruvate dehydrogenase E2 component (dihydrolipoamide acetyltransferase)